MSALPLEDPPELAKAKKGQFEAATPDACAWVEANAGSGKTKVLIDRVARLLLKGAAPDSITCVTYTKAAASEMQDRLFGVLGEWCVMETPRLRAELAKLEQRDDFTEEELGLARELFARALETPGGLRIETIHAFCGRVLRRFPLEAGVAPGFQELDDEAAAELWDDALRSLGAKVGRDKELASAAHLVYTKGGSFSLVQQLDTRRASILDFLRDGLEVAVERLRSVLGAPDASEAELLDQAVGSGLPRTELHLALNAFRGGTSSDLDQAARLATVLSDLPADERFDSYLRMFLTDKGELRSRTFTKATGAAHPAMAGLFGVEPPEGSETARVLTLAAAIRARRIYERSSALLQLAHVAFADYQKRKAARAGLDFDDLIHGVDRLLSQLHAAQWVLWKLDAGIAHLLLDEAQDTSPAQWSILRKLTKDIFDGAGAVRELQRTLFVVGDAKQSIYSFQGADPEAFLDQGRAIKDTAHAVGVRFEDPHLAMSWRSVPEVLRYVDEVFDPQYFTLKAPFSLQPPVESDRQRHTAQRSQHMGCVELWPLEEPVETSEPDPWDAPLDQQSQSSPVVKLARQVAAFVKREISTGASVFEKGERRPARPGDFLILVKRRTGGLFEAILQQLKSLNVPVAGADRIQLLESLPVQDLLNLVRFAVAPDDDLVLAEILKSPFGGLNDDDLLELCYDRPGSLWRQVEASPLKQVEAPRGFLRSLLAHRGDAPFEFLTRALEQAHGHARPGWELMLSRFGDPAREPMTALLDRAAAFDVGSPASLELFLAAVEHHGGEVKRELSGPQDEVRVMTVHGAKGLQAPIVILPDSTSAPKQDVSGLFVHRAPEKATVEEKRLDGAPLWVGPKAGDTPLTAAMRLETSERGLREHRRLLYVALTRAQDRLLVCGAWNNRFNGGRDKNSWYALCDQGMRRLVEKGAAREFSEDGRAILRYGDPADLLFPAIDPHRDLVEPDWLRKAVAPEAGPQRILSPSALAGFEPPPIPPFGKEREARLKRGRLIHKLLETLPDIPPRSRRKAARDFLARQAGCTTQQREEMLEAAFKVLEDEQFAAVFAPGGHAEAPVIGRIGNDIVNGRVDRLVVTENEVLIVDFKTDRPAPPSSADVGPAYLAQMNAYASALAEAWPGRRVRRLLVWTDGPRLMEV